MVVSAQSDIGPNNTTANVLQALVLASNTLLVARCEICEVVYVCEGDTLAQKLRCYLSDSWNWFDIFGVLALYVATAAHFVELHSVLRPVGAAGVLSNAFSLLQLLRPFDSTGPLIKIIVEI